MNLTLHPIYLPYQFLDNIFIHEGRQETGEIHVHSRHRDLAAPNLETLSVFGIVAIPTQLVVIPFLRVPFLRVPFLVKTHAHRTDSLAQRRFLLFIYF